MKRSVLLASDFFRPGLVWVHLVIAAMGTRRGAAIHPAGPPSRQNKESLPPRAGGCLFRSGREAMNVPKAETGERGKNRGQMIYLVDDEPMLLELASVILEPL